MKKIMLISGIVLFVILSASSYYLYCSYNPDINISLGGREGEEYNIDIISVTISNRHNILEAKQIQDQLSELWYWNNGIIEDLIEIQKYTTPFDIKVTGEIEDGKTTLRYEGIVTTKDGVTKEYREEKVFDFVLDPDMKIPKST